jgi:hypothetical protein
MNILQPIYNDCFPVRIFTTQTRKNTKPWFTNGLYNSSMKKDCLYKKYLLNPDISTKTTYTNYRNKYNYLVKLARKSYYHNKLLNHKSDLRATWSIIRSVIGSKQKNRIPSTMKNGSGTYSNPHSIANKFNNFFINVGTSSLSNNFTDISDNKHI